MEFQKFVDALPSDQTAVDIFKGHWASKLPGGLESGSVPLFDIDSRPGWALKAFGPDASSFNGAQILELGPLEGGHTYKLEQLGGEVTAIESNAEAFLKCLIAKEIYGLKSKFMLGNFITYMENTDRKYDLLFASGVLYHMMDPLHLIELICSHSDRSFLWSHYYNPDVCEDFTSNAVQYKGYEADHFYKDYSNRYSGTFWGGLADGARWLKKDDLIEAYRHFGHSYVEVIDEAPNGQNGPSLSLISRRQ